MKVAILTDTNSGINDVEAGELGIYVIPMPVLIDDEVFFEGQNISEEEFFTALKSDRNVHTSQPSPGDLMDKWDELLGMGFEQVVFIPMSSGLSGTCQTAKSCAMDYEGKVFVVDNHRISATMKFSVLEAKKMADSGKSGKEIQEHLEKTAYDASIYLAVSTLDYLKKGGRISPTVARIGNALNIKPILEIRGEKLELYAFSRGNIIKCQKKMIDAIKKDIKERFAEADWSQLQLLSAGANLSEKEQKEWMDMISKEFDGADVKYDPLSASISTHTGPGAFGVGVCYTKL